MMDLLILLLWIWLLGGLAFIVLLWNKVTAGTKLELIACALIWPKYLFK